MVYEELLSLSWTYVLIEFPTSAKNEAILGGYYSVTHIGKQFSNY